MILFISNKFSQKKKMSISVINLPSKKVILENNYLSCEKVNVFKNIFK